MTKKLSNTITVYHVDGKPMSYIGASIVIDNCDESISIKKKGETVAHYKRDSYLKVIQEIRFR